MIENNEIKNKIKKLTEKCQKNLNEIEKKITLNEENGFANIKVEYSNIYKKNMLWINTEDYILTLIDLEGLNDYLTETG